MDGLSRSHHLHCRPCIPNMFLAGHPIVQCSHCNSLWKGRGIIVCCKLERKGVPAPIKAPSCCKRGEGSLTFQCSIQLQHVLRCTTQQHGCTTIYGASSSARCSSSTRRSPSAQGCSSHHQPRRPSIVRHAAAPGTLDDHECPHARRRHHKRHPRPHKHPVNLWQCSHSSTPP